MFNVQFTFQFHSRNILPTNFLLKRIFMSNLADIKKGPEEKVVLLLNITMTNQNMTRQDDIQFREGIKLKKALSLGENILYHLTLVSLA